MTTHVFIPSPEADGSAISLCRGEWLARLDLAPERTSVFCAPCVAVDRRRTPADRAAGRLPRDTDRLPVPFRLADEQGFRAPKTQTDAQCQASTEGAVVVAKDHASVEVWPRRFEVRPGNRGATPLTHKAKARAAVELRASKP